MNITNPYNPKQGLMIISSTGSQKYTERLDSYSRVLTNLYVSTLNDNNKYCIDSCWESGNIYYANYDDGYVRKIQYDGTVISTLNLTNPFMVSVIQNATTMNSIVIYPPQEDQGCWIADRGTGKIIKANNDLHKLYELSGIANPLCIKANIDGGCYVVNGGNLIKVSSKGVILSTKSYASFTPVVTSFIDMVIDANGLIWFCANDRLYNLNTSMFQNFVKYPLGADDPFSSSSSEIFPEEEKHIGAIDVDRNVANQPLYVAGGNSYESFIIKYNYLGALLRDKKYYDISFPYILKVIQGNSSDSLYILEDSAKWDTFGYGSSSSSSSNSSSSSSTEIRSSSSSSGYPYIITGTMSPDCTGNYSYSGEYNGRPMYSNGVYSIWWGDSGYNWLLNTLPGNWARSWNSPTSSITGTYDPTPYQSPPSYTGNPIVSLG